MRKGGPDILRLVSIGLIVASVALLFYEMVVYSRQRAHMPPGLTIAGIPVGGLNQTEAVERILQTYSTPVELHYNDQIILLSPASVGFTLDTEVMLAAAELTRTGTDFWGGFWDFVWKRPGDVEGIPLRAEYSRPQLEAALQDIALRYDEPPLPSRPIPGTPSFRPGEPGTVLSLDRAVELVAEILTSPADRRVVLPVVASAPPPPSMLVLETLIKQNIDVAGFDGLAVIYVQDLRNGNEMHFSYFRNGDFSSDPDVAFTAASIIKIPIMASYYRHYDEPVGEEAETWLWEMITESENGPADRLMEQLDENLGPLLVTEMLQELGLESTFLAGYFYPGAPLLEIYQTPGNQRLDIDTDPDIYNQTTASEMGMLLGDIYACAQGGGAMLARYPGEITPEECSSMLDYLSENNIGILIEAGVPEGTRVAHKHGWTSSPMETLADAGIVFSPGGDYVISLFLWNTQEMIWLPTSRLFADLARSVYNYFNTN
jgi:beta-lactamase class A